MDKEIVQSLIEFVVGPIAVGVATFVLTSRQNKKHYEDKIREHEESIIKLTYHPVFQRLKSLQTAIELEFTLKNKGKERIFRDILYYKVQIFHDNLYKLAEETESCIKTCDTDVCNGIYNRNMKVFDESVIDYNNFYRNSDYNPDEQRCLDLVMSKFNKWHKDRADNTKLNIELIANSLFYTDCRSRQGAIFDLYIGAFVETLNDAEKTLNELNGDLKGLVYKGVTL